MRRLLVFISVVVAVDTLFFTAMTPLLPHFADKYDLSKAGAGVFISTYAAGALIGAPPSSVTRTGGCGGPSSGADGMPPAAAVPPPPTRGRAPSTGWPGIPVPASG